MIPSTKSLFLANVILTLPFALIMLVAPGAMFNGFGLTLDAGGELVARGYAATLAGYGLAFYLLRNIAETGHQKSLLVAAMAFNLIEAVIQTMAAMDGIVTPTVWLTIGLHVIVFLLCGFAWINLSKKA